MKTRTGKWCPSCKQWLTVKDFRPNPDLRHGIDSWCRECHKNAMREWRARNREYIDAYNAQRRAEYRAEHPLPTRPCVVCGESFTGRPNALVCGPECRRQRKIQQRRRLREAA